jgi:hypothetical protein
VHALSKRRPKAPADDLLSADIAFGVGFPTIGHEANAREVEKQVRPFAEVGTWITEGF